MATITKKELVNRIADRTGQTKVITKDIIQMFLDEIIHELASGNRLEFRDFGVFEVKQRRARMGPAEANRRGTRHARSPLLQSHVGQLARDDRRKQESYGGRIVHARVQ